MQFVVLGSQSNAMGSNQGDTDGDDRQSQGLNPYEVSEAEINPVHDSVPMYASAPLAIALVALVVGAFVIDIGLGISVFVLAVPAYIRAVASSFRKVAAGQDVSNIDRVLAFIGSLGVVILSCIAGGIGFFVTCLALLSSNNINQQQEVLIFSVLAAGFFVSAGVVYFLFWPKRRG